MIRSSYLGAGIGLALAAIGGTAAAATYQADVLVVGGSLGAPAAALAAQRAWPGARVILTEPTDWLGGQATSQGVAAIDNAWHDPGASLMRNNQSTYYPADYRNWLSRISSKPTTAPGEGMAPNGTGWVSRECFDPRTGAWALDTMLAETSVTVLKMTVVKSVVTSNTVDAYGSAKVITSANLVQRTAINGYTPFTKYLSAEVSDWYSTTDSSDFSKQAHTIVPVSSARGMVVIDASETADAVVLSGANYVVGRDQTTETVTDAGVVPTHQETGSQATVYPFCMTMGANDPETSLQSTWADFSTYYSNQVSGFFSLGSYSWAQVWTYRRLRLGRTPPASNTVVNQGDVSMQNWNPGNDYPTQSMWLDKSSASTQSSDWLGGLNTTALSNAEKHAVAWYFYMKANKTTTTDTRLARGSDTYNFMGTPHGLSKFPYIRCGRRIIGLDNFRLTQLFFTPASTSSPTSFFRFWDSVGIGNYACDVHPVTGSSGIGVAVTTPAPFYVPFRALGSQNVRNLLAGGKNFAGTYGSNSAYRLHPIEWVIGSAAGSAAALMARDTLSNRDMLATSTMRSLQNTIRTNSPIHWAAYDSTPIPPQNGDIIVNGFQAPLNEGTPFFAEMYHPTAVKAKIYLNNVYVGDTTYRANGRLVASGLQATGGLVTVRADLYDANNNFADSLVSNAIQVASFRIVDDPDSGFSRTGTWGTTANSNKWGSTCFIALGTGNATPSVTATWQLNLPGEGYYLIETYYSDAGNRATNAPFTISHMAGNSTVNINQTQSGVWVDLGTFQFRGNSPTLDKVTLNNANVATNQYVVADAIRATLVTATPVAVSHFSVE